MANKTHTIIDGDFTEVKTAANTETETPVEPTPEADKTEIEKKSLIAKIGNGAKKYGPACVKLLIGTGMIYGLYRIGKATTTAAASLPETIKEPGGEKIYTVISGSVPKEALNEAELEKWNDAVSQLKSVMDEARTRLAVAATEE